MKRMHSMIALLVIMAVLAGLYAYLSHSRGNEQAEQEVIEISELDENKITQIVLKNKNTGEELVFERQTRASDKKEQDSGSGENDEPDIETIWVVTKPYPVELIQSKVTELAGSFSDLTAEIIVEEDPQDLSIYGLENPSVIGTVSLQDGTKTTLYLGNKTADGITWYLMKEGDPKVYTVADLHGLRLSYSLSEFRNRDLPDIDLSTIKYLYISGEDKREIEIIGKKNSGEEQSGYNQDILEINKPYKTTMRADSYKLKKILGNINDLTIREFIDDHPADYSEYGLDQPGLSLIIEDEENTLELVFGSSLEDGTIYFKTGDSEGVYLMDEASIEFLSFEPFDILDKYVLWYNIQDIDEVIIEGRGRKHTLSITRTDEGLEEGEVQSDQTYFLDGKEVEKKYFEDFHKSLIGIVIDAEKAHSAHGTPELKITYHFNKDDLKTRIIEFYPYDEGSCSLVLDGDMESEFLVYHKRVDWVFSSLDELIAGHNRDE